MKVIQDEGARPIKLWTEDIEDAALQQLRNTARLPFLHPHGVAAMPDVHFGIGATVGSVVATQGAVIPAAVGVDIGCGMCAVRTSLTASDLPDSLAKLRSAIERGVPTGFGEHTNAGKVEKLAAGLPPINTALLADIIYNRVGMRMVEKSVRQIGTLGGGNHFIEVCLDEEQRVWVMLHSGSRGIGNVIGKHFIEIAKREMEKYFISLPDKDLAYLPEGTQHFEDYCAAVGWAQDYARHNRDVMLAEVLRNLAYEIRPFDLTAEAINCHHNYVERENHFGRNVLVTRKGAIRAREGDLGIIPGSMGQRSYIVRGLGNPHSYCSCSHGAGRRMGRKEAARRFTVDDLIAQTAGVECRKDAAVLDEIPGAYKDIDTVMENQKDLVEVCHTLKQVLCVKGA